MNRRRMLAMIVVGLFGGIVVAVVVTAVVRAILTSGWPAVAVIVGVILGASILAWAGEELAGWHDD